MTGGVPTGRDGQAADAVEAVGFVCLAGFCVVVGVALALNVSGASASRPSFKVEDTINPNDASPASLSRLPSIGPARAKEIVSYRNQSRGRVAHGPVFGGADDLGSISGIGPATIEAIRPWLSFDSGPADREDIVDQRP